MTSTADSVDETADASGAGAADGEQSPDDTAACTGWDGRECEGTAHCPPRCPRFVDKRGTAWTIRPAVLEDAAQLAEMYEGFGGQNRAQGLPPITRSRRATWIETLLTNGSNVVAEREGELFGHATYTPTEKDRPELAVFVHPSMQGRGLGTELCRHVVADAAAGNRDELTLHVETGNQVARSVYENIGFEVVERQGDITMRLPLDGQVATEVRWPPLVREGPSDPSTGDRTAEPVSEETH